MATLVESRQALESLRDTDFDAYSAYAEVIDNSLQADAEHINIKFQLSPPRNQRVNIEALAFGDDGKGMDFGTLQRCLTIGWSSRYNDRKGIGRFGVGMTLAAIHECKRVEVWSKQRGGDWLFTYIDIEEVVAETMSEIPTPEKRALPPDFAALAGKTQGTLVVWRKYDRQMESGDKIVEQFKVWAGRTFRYFIWDVIQPRPSRATIVINQETVCAIDPLYARTDKTRFEKDERSEVFADQTLTWPTEEELQKAGAPPTSNIVIRMSCLPETFRKRRGDGDSKASQERHIDENEGISILRNHREVFYGPLPRWAHGDGWSSFEDIDRWWGCEVLFSPELDRSFTVKVIKRGAVPEGPLKWAIKGKILPTRNTVIERVRRLWDETALKERDEQDKQEGANIVHRANQKTHAPAEQAAKIAAVPKSQLDEGVNENEAAAKVANSFVDRYNEAELKCLEELFKSQPFTIMEESSAGPLFYESKFLGGKAVLLYNKSHKLWAALDALVARLPIPDAAVATEIRVMVDLLIIAHAKAEAMFGPDAQLTAKEFTDQIRLFWGQYLTSYINARTRVAM